MATTQKTEWYGVKTLFRLIAVGKPKNPDKAFDPTSTLVEERVVLFKGESFEDAIKQAEDEAREYCETTHFVNIYGQPVNMRFLGAVEAYALFDAVPSTGCEVYSSTAIAPSVCVRRETRERAIWQARETRGRHPIQIRRRSHPQRCSGCFKAR